MLEIKSSDGTTLHTLGGRTYLEAAHVAFIEYGTDGGTTAMLPAATSIRDEYILLAVMKDGRIFDSTLRLVGSEG